MPEPDPGSGRPEAAECLVPDGDVLSRLERQMVETAAYLDGFTPEQAGGARRPGSGTRSRSSATSPTPSASSATARSTSRALIRSCGARCAPSPGAWPATMHHLADIRRQHAAATAAAGSGQASAARR